MIKIPRQARKKSKTGIYHVMLRGANKQEIFHDDEDNMRFLDTIIKYKKQLEFNIFAWCLMNNHAHLLIKEGKEELSITMKRIEVSYVHYYNRKYNTTGHLFQDRYRSENVETKRYFMTVLRYIHQNSMKAGLVSRVEDWTWSSCSGYYDKGCYYQHLLDSDSVLKLFSGNKAIAVEDFRKFNEQNNNDSCFENQAEKGRRLTDEEARDKIKEVLGTRNLAQVKSLPKSERDDLLRKVKEIEGLSQRQGSRILGVSVSLIHRA
ncbi:transposase [Gracilibacillus kekensis]|uniref:transposase n=1 Tax=Gracilibacillus kekensis TaxID=1027249 RepID=UPI00313959CE